MICWGTIVLEVPFPLDQPMTSKSRALGVALVGIFWLVGCEYAFQVGLSRKAKAVLAGLDRESASEIVRKNLAATHRQLGFHGFHFHTFQNDKEFFEIFGAPTEVSLIGTVLHFKRGPESRIETNWRPTSGSGGDVVPGWFVTSEYEFDLTKLDHVMLWEPVYFSKEMRSGFDMELRLYPPSSDDTASVWLLIARENVPEVTAALKYLSPRITFTAAR